MAFVLSYDDACELYLRECPEDRGLSLVSMADGVALWAREKGYTVWVPREPRFSCLFNGLEVGLGGEQGNHGEAVASTREFPEVDGSTDDVRLIISLLGWL